MEHLTRGQQTAHRLLALLDRHRQCKTDEKEEYRLDLEALRSIAERALSDPVHPVNAVLLQVRGWHNWGQETKPETETADA